MSKVNYLQISDIADVNELFLEFCKIIDLNPIIVKRAFLKVAGTDRDVRKYVPSADELFSLITMNGERWQMKMTMRLEYVKDGFSEEEHEELLKKFDMLLPEVPPVSKTHQLIEKQREQVNPDLLPEKKDYVTPIQESKADRKMELPDFL